MIIRVAKSIGYCLGVRRAVETANKAPKDTCVLGELIHNQHVIDGLSAKGIKTIACVEEIGHCNNLIIRSHGASESIYSEAQQKGIRIIDCTCPFVAKIHRIVKKYDELGYQIIITGSPTHAEVIGINSCCKNRATVVSSVEECQNLILGDRVCVVSQTTFNAEMFEKIIQILSQHECKTLEKFNTICYTTLERQKEAERLAQSCDKILILGCPNSSNTNQLYRISNQWCKFCYLINDVKELSCITFDKNDCVGITSGASTHDELIQEVLQFMSENNEVQMSTFGEMLEKQENESVVCRVGAVIKDAVVISATEEGVTVSIGGKNDGFIAKEEAVSEGEYNPAEYTIGSKVGVVVLAGKNKDTGLVPVSKKKLDLINKGNEVVNTIRNGEEFDLVVGEVVPKGLIGRLGNYRVFIPQSQVEERFVKNLAPYKGKTLRLRALEIDDEKHKIVASQKAVVCEERESKEKEFFDNIYPDAVVIGKVVRATKFGAFVNVGGFDCLAHIVDLSWTKINAVEDILKIGEEYEFIVLKIDREKKRVSLGYKQLHLHPFDEVVKNHNVGDVIDGTVVRIKDFGAFVKIADGVDGLVHISEASHNFVKNINDVLKVGDEVKAVITKIDYENRKISLSIKAATEAPAGSEQDGDGRERKPRMAKGDRKGHGDRETSNWNEDIANNPFADLLKGMKSDD